MIIPYYTLLDETDQKVVRGGTFKSTTTTTLVFPVIYKDCFYLYTYALGLSHKLPLLCVYRMREKCKQGGKKEGFSFRVFNNKAGKRMFVIRNDLQLTVYRQFGSWRV